MQCLGNLPRRGGNRAAVFELRGKHPLLHEPRKEREQREHRKQNQRKSRIPHRDDRQNRENPAGIGNHADNPRGEERLHGVHIPRKAGGDLPRFLRNERGGGQTGQFPRHFGAQSMGHPLSEQHKERFLRRGQHTLQRETAEIEQYRRTGKRDSAREVVDHAGKQQRRNQRRTHRHRNAHKRSDGQNRMRQRRRADCREHARLGLIRFLPLHDLPLLSGFHTAFGKPGSTPSVRRAFRRLCARPP